jgi:hypothetical protein
MGGTAPEEARDAMTHPVSVYGFGSFFHGCGEPEDVDILLLHRDISYDSCRQAIEFKATIVRALKNAHVVMLSRPEERGLSFRERAKATYLGDLLEQADVCALAERINSWSAKTRSISGSRDDTTP